MKPPFRHFERIEDVPPDHRGPFTVGDIRDRDRRPMPEALEMSAWDRVDAEIDADDREPMPDDDFVHGRGEP